MKKLILAFICLFLAIPCQAKIITVDDDGPADFNNIQAAINAASEGDEVVVSIGTYHENINFGGKNIILCSTQSATPSVVSSTIIDGDFVGSVVRFSGSETESCVLSGFTITNGRASGGVGGGIYCPAGSSPTVTNCTIAGSRATGSGGGIGGAGNPTINNCIITGNKAVWDTGGGISLWGGSATIVNCTISGNLAYRGGGGIHSCNSSPTITNCTINANTAYKGAGIFCEGSSNPTIANCTIAGNSAEWSGGGINWAYSNPTLTNCTFVGNSAPNGSAIACGPCGSPPCMLQLTNCILWDGSHEIWNNYDSALTITYSDIQGGWPGTGNIDADPCFARLGTWQVEGDYHLKSQAGRWTSASSVEPDANEGRWTKDGVTSPCIDAGDIYSPIGYEPFPNGGRINMGAYGGTADASKSYFGKPVCETIVAGDINGDCEVNFKDFALMALHWLECIEPNQGRWRLVEDDTEDSYSCEGNFDVSFPCSNAVDEDWDTYALPADGGAPSIIYENYIIPAGIAMADFTIKYRQTAPVTPGLCTNVTDYWDGSTWKELNCTALTNQTSTLTVRIPDDALSGSTLQLRTRIWKSLGIPGSGSGMYYEGKVIWYLLPVCQTIVAGDKKANEK